MKLILDEAGFFGKLSDKIRKQKNILAQERQDWKDNKDLYAKYDEALNDLVNKGYSNREVNTIGKYLKNSKNFNQSSEFDKDENIIYNLAMNNKLDVEKIDYLGKISQSNQKLSKEDLNYLASAGTLNQMKALYYASTLGIKFKDIGQFNGKPPRLDVILSAINNFKAVKHRDDTSEIDKDISVKGYSTKFYDKLSAGVKNKLADRDIANGYIAQALGKSDTEIMNALSNLTDTPMYSGLGGDSYIEAVSNNLNIPANAVNAFTLDQIKNMTISSLRNKLNKNSKEQKAEEINNNAANDN